MNTYILAITLCIICWIQEGVAINCYQCDSDNDPDCTEEFDHANKDSLTIRSSECQVDAASHCIKTTGVWGGVVGTTRFCSSRDMGNQCQYVTYPDHDRTYRACIYTCSRHHCNAAHSNQIASIATVTLASLTALYMWASHRL